jgi:hypothetical protein
MLSLQDTLAGMTPATLSALETSEQACIVAHIALSVASDAGDATDALSDDYSAAVIERDAQTRAAFDVDATDARTLRALMTLALSEQSARRSL